MSKNYSYKSLSLEKYKGVYYDSKPQKVLTAQDPYNAWSYKTTVATKCSLPNNTRTSVLEDYRHPYSLNDPFNEDSYSNPKC